MNPAYTVRFATADDAPLMVRHRRRMFEDMNYTDYIQSPGIDARYLAWLGPALTEGRCVGWLVLHENAVVGGGAVEIFERSPHPITLESRYAHIVNVYVEPEHRRQGIARQLMLTMLDWCRAHNLRVITLQASEFGRSLYESLGFRGTAEMRLVLRPEQD
jgi:GNAT superfamily N-acetyltransferase